MTDVFLDKDKFVRIKRDLLGPPPKKFNIMFIDDINMPLPDKYGS